MICCTECYSKDIDYYGHDIGRKKDLKSANECQKQCQSDSKCHFWTWGSPKAKGKRKLKCYLKNKKATKGTSKQIGVVSGPKFC